MSGLLQETRRLSFHSVLGTNRLVLTGVRGREALSTLFRFELSLQADDQTIQPGQLVGTAASVEFVRPDGKTRWLHGYISRFSAGMQSRTGKLRHYRAELVPWMWFLTRTTDCRIFQDMTVIDIISQIFGDLGFKEFSTAGIYGKYPKREYCVQYRESDFAFVSRLMEEEGIYYWFEHSQAGHQLVLADDIGIIRSCDEKVVPYQRSTTHHRVADGITHFERHCAYRTGAATHTDYNFKTPARNMFASDKAILPVQAHAVFENYDYPGNYVDRTDGARLARIRVQQQEVDHETASGISHCSSFMPGRKFSIKTSPLHASTKTPYLITTVEHEISEVGPYETVGGDDHNLSPDGFNYQNTFECIPDNVVYRPTRLTPRPIVEGPQTAVIVGPPGEEIYTDEFARVKVQFHWDREGRRNESSSCWIRVSQSHAGSKWGGIDMPRIGEEVIVSFLEGDPDRPIITGRVYNALNMPPFGLPGEKTRTGLKSKTHKGGGYNEISLDDTAGKEQIRIHGQYNMDSVIGNNQTLKVGVNQSENVGSNRTRQVGANETVQVGANQAITVGTNQQTTVGQNIVINAGTSITLKCGAATIHMNQAGVITISGTLVTMAGAINANVAAPITNISGAMLLTQTGMVNLSAGVVNRMDGAATAVVNSGGTAALKASGDAIVQGAAVKLN